MAEPPKDPSIGELFDKITALESENVRLTERVASLERGSSSTHSFFMKLSDKVGMIDLRTIDLMEKAFPGWAKTQVQLIDIFKGKGDAD